jgi:NADH-quinone oxidoreductase subunit F
MLTAKEIENLPMDFDGVAAAKSMLGSAAIIVMDETTDIPKAVTNIAKFFAHESCGQCTPCREGSGWLARVCRRVARGEGEPGDIELMANVANGIGGNTICALGDAAALPVKSFIKHFRDEFQHHIDHKKCLVPDYV